MFKTLLRKLHKTENRSHFHLVCVSLFLTGLFIALSAGDLGPFSPMLISIGIYVMLFPLIMETGYWFLAGLRRATRRWVQA